MFRSPRLAIAASAEAPYDNYTVFETTKPPRERKQHGWAFKPCKKELGHCQCLSDEASRQYYQPCGCGAYDGKCKFPVFKGSEPDP